MAVFTTYRLPWRRLETLLAWARELAATGQQRGAEAKQRAACAVADELDAATRWRHP